jgi:hypothetical protein
MALGRVFPGILAVLVAAVGGVFLFQFAASAYWRIPVEVSRMPCTLRPGSAFEFFFPVPHPRLTGIGLEYLPEQNLPEMSLELRTIPGDTLFATARLAPRGLELVGIFAPKTIAPHAQIKARLAIDSAGAPVLLHCRPLAAPGPAQERPVVHTYHTLGRTMPAAVGAWLRARVAPLLPPGALPWAVAFLAVVPLVMALAVWAAAGLPGVRRVT